MTEESHQRATELLKLIGQAKTNLDKWEKAQSFTGCGEVTCNFHNSTGYSFVLLSHVPFNIAKTLSIEGYKNELESLEKEFNAL